eukprot:jgi/Galph1/6047/GphlegSOOS_G4707.1
MEDYSSVEKIWLPLGEDCQVEVDLSAHKIQCYRLSSESMEAKGLQTGNLHDKECTALAWFSWPSFCEKNIKLEKIHNEELNRQEEATADALIVRACKLECSCGSFFSISLSSAVEANDIQVLEVSLGFGKHSKQQLEVSKDEKIPSITFELPSSGHWYGGAHSLRQFWPVERACLELGPYYPFDNGPQGLCGLVDPSWVSSKGVVLSVDPYRSKFLHIGFHSPVKEQVQRHWNIGLENFAKELLPLSDSHTEGNQLLQIEARNEYDVDTVIHPLSYSKTFQTEFPCISFVFGMQPNVRKAAELLLKYLPSCNKTPPATALMKNPIWTTWARFKQDITQHDVEEFAKEIVEFGYPYAVMEIDDRWSRKYGDLTFDENKFPNPKKMVDKLHALGFLVTLWIIPFADEDSSAVLENDVFPRHYFVREKATSDTSSNNSGTEKQTDNSSSFRWWQPTIVKAIDVTNSKACDWFLGQLYQLQRDYGIDGFKFDAGEPCFLPKNPSFQETLCVPDEYTLYWNRNIASKFPIREIRAACRGCQPYVSFLRLFDKFSVWDFGNGLASIIPATLVAGMVGYPFVLPDIVGGNCYDDRKLNEELFIRWLELSIAMPSIQLSIVPWQFNDSVAALCKQILESRTKFIPFIEEALEETLSTGWPIIRPLWWQSPTIPETWMIDDEFTVGDNLLVAPVVQPSQYCRDIWLPCGTWTLLNLTDAYSQDLGEYNGKQIVGPCWLRSFPCPIHILPCFSRA